jgi:hypothetical protein
MGGRLTGTFAVVKRFRSAADSMASSGGGDNRGMRISRVVRAQVLYIRHFPSRENVIARRWPMRQLS